MDLGDGLLMVAAVAAVVAMLWLLRSRRRGSKADALELAREQVCPHLQPALELLLSRGHQVTRVGQKLPELPLEVHFAPAFDPKALHDELRLAEPVFLSERNVLYCKDDWCELHPRA